MRAPRSLIGSLAGLRLFRTLGGRAVVFGVLAALFALLAFFPERYRAAATLSPTDPQSLGLSATLGQLGAINNVFGNQAAVEVALRIANSVYARDIVIDKLKLQQRLGKNRVEAQRWLERKVGIRSMRGGIILIEMEDRDATLSKEIVGSFAEATQQRLAVISRNQTRYKRDVLLQLVSEASRKLADAQATYDAFRLRNRTPSPLTAVEAVSQSIPQLEGAIKAKAIQIQSSRQLYTDENNVVRQLKAEYVSLQEQLARVKATGAVNDTSVGRAVQTSSQLFKLERDLFVARTLYDGYMRFLQGTAVEDLTSTANIRILEPPFVDTDRQIWMPAAAAALLVLLLWGAIEFYRLRPPLGAQLKPEVA